MIHLVVYRFCGVIGIIPNMSIKGPNKILFASLMGLAVLLTTVHSTAGPPVPTTKVKVITTAADVSLSGDLGRADFVIGTIFSTSLVEKSNIATTVLVDNPVLRKGGVPVSGLMRSEMNQSSLLFINQNGNDHYGGSNMTSHREIVSVTGERLAGDRKVPANEIV